LFVVWGGLLVVWGTRGEGNHLVTSVYVIIYLSLVLVYMYYLFDFFSFSRGRYEKKWRSGRNGEMNGRRKEREVDRG